MNTLPDGPVTLEGGEMMPLHFLRADTNCKCSVNAGTLEVIAQRFNLAFPGWKKQEAYELMIEVEHFHYCSKSLPLMSFLCESFPLIRPLLF